MALIYGMICSWIVVLRKFAAWKHNRLKKNYENAEASFKSTEQDCKNDEVAMGRPAGYASQLRLMKQYEAVESARTRWISAERKLSKRQRWESRIKSLQGRKIPYSFGLLDMALVLKLTDFAREAGRFDLSIVQDFLMTLFN